MRCPVCDDQTIVTAFPEDLRGYLPDDPGTVAVCRRCLTVTPLDGDNGSTADDPSTVADLSDALPSDPRAALLVAVFVTLCDSLALYRSEIEELVARIEHAGVDPLSTLDRLAADPTVELPFDAERRRPQLVQLLR